MDPVVEELIKELQEMPSEMATDIVDIPNQDTVPQIYDFEEEEAKG